MVDMGAGISRLPVYRVSYYNRLYFFMLLMFFHILIYRIFSIFTQDVSDGRTN